VRVTVLFLTPDALPSDRRCRISVVRLVRGTVSLGVFFTQSARRMCLLGSSVVSVCMEGRLLRRWEGWACGAGGRRMSRRWDGVNGGVRAAHVELSWSRGRQVRWTLCGSAWCTRRRYPHGGGSVGNNHCVRFSLNVPLSTKHWYIRTFEEPFLPEMLKHMLIYRFNVTGLGGIWKSLTGQVFRSSLGMSIED